MDLPVGCWRHIVETSPGRHLASASTPAIHKKRARPVELLCVRAGERISKSYKTTGLAVLGNLVITGRGPIFSAGALLFPPTPASDFREGPDRHLPERLATELVYGATALTKLSGKPGATHSGIRDLCKPALGLKNAGGLQPAALGCENVSKFARSWSNDPFRPRPLPHLRGITLRRRCAFPNGSSTVPQRYVESIGRRKRERTPTRPGRERPDGIRSYTGRTPET